jgi:hypothetical protein
MLSNSLPQAWIHHAGASLGLQLQAPSRAQPETHLHDGVTHEFARPALSPRHEGVALRKKTPAPAFWPGKSSAFHLAHGHHYRLPFLDQGTCSCKVSGHVHILTLHVPAFFWHAHRLPLGNPSLLQSRRKHLMRPSVRHNNHQGS